MEGSFGFRCLLLFTVSQVVAGNSFCYNNMQLFSTYLSDPYLYLKYEEALLKDHYHLEELRATFISTSPRYVNLFVILSAESLNNTYCDNNISNPTFCSTSQHTWALCSECSPLIALEYTAKCTIDKKELLFYAIAFVSFMHGSFTGVYLPFYKKIRTGHFNDYLNYFHSCYEKNYTQQIELNLRCNPSCDSTQQILSDVLSWVSNFDRKWPLNKTLW